MPTFGMFFPALVLIGAMWRVPEGLGRWRGRGPGPLGRDEASGMV